MSARQRLQWRAQPLDASGELVPGLRGEMGTIVGEYVDAPGFRRHQLATLSGATLGTAYRLSWRTGPAQAWTVLGDETPRPAPDAVEHTPGVTTWADGFGVWHVRVPRDAASSLIAARRAIRDELTARAPRGQTLPRSAWVDLVRVPDLDTTDTVVYREPVDGDDDDQPAGEPTGELWTVIGVWDDGEAVAVAALRGEHHPVIDGDGWAQPGYGSMAGTAMASAVASVSAR